MDILYKLRLSIDKIETCMALVNSWEINKDAHKSLKRTLKELRREIKQVYLEDIGGDNCWLFIGEYEYDEE
jgi:hypothetical protein